MSQSTFARATLVVGRLGLAYLFFSQLFWKLPPTFGCPDDYAFTTRSQDGTLVRTSGLCDWLGVQAVFATEDRTFLATDLDNDGSPEISVPLGPLVRANGTFVTNVVQPRIALFGWLVFLVEAWIALSLSIGLLTRLGALTSLLLSVQLALGLAGVDDGATGLHEWEWTYHLMVIASVMVLGTAPGRFLGVDGWLRQRLAPGRSWHSAVRRWT